MQFPGPTGGHPGGLLPGGPVQLSGLVVAGAAVVVGATVVVVVVAPAVVSVVFDGPKASDAASKA